jgi:hypothetical protein
LWDLPGPTFFLEGLIDTLRDGSHLVIHLPDTMSEGFADHLEDALDQESFSTKHLELDSGNDNPQNTCLYDEEGHQHSLQHLCTDPDCLTASVLILDSVQKDDFPLWSEWLESYERASQRVDQFDRTRVVLLVRGVPRSKLQFQGTLISQVEWNGVLDVLDTLLYASGRLRDRVRDSRKRLLLSHVIANYACWDPNVTKRLASLEPEQFFHPKEVLLEIAEEYGWTPDTPKSWERGIEGRWGERTMLHSAYVALQNDQRELERRLWQAQASVLLPLIEQYRVKLLPSIRRWLRPPIHLENRTIDEVEDLEVGDIYSLLKQARVRDTGLTNQIYRLREVRNKLAHLTPLTLSTVLDDNLLLI